MKALSKDPMSFQAMLFLQVKEQWRYFKSESLAFKAICMYLFIEFFRPQSIFRFLDFLPWGQVFLGLAIIGILFDKDAKARFSSTHFFIILFAIAIHLSFLTAYNSAWSHKYYINFIQWIIMFFVVTTIVSNPKRFYVFFIVWFLCSLKIAIGTARIWAFRGFGFTNWGIMGPPGYFQNSGELAILMLTLFPIGFYLYKNLKNDVRKWEKYILLASFVCPVMTILGSSSRGAQIALVIQLTIMFWRKIFKPKFLVGMVIVASLGWQVLPEEQKERFTKIGQDRSSLQRQFYWEHGWEMMKDHPLLGVGYYNFIPYYIAHYREDTLYSKVELPHNIFIQVGTDAGFIGLAFYLFLILIALTARYPVKATFSEKEDAILRQMWLGLKLGILGYLVAGQFVSVAYYPFLWYSIAMQTIFRGFVGARLKTGFAQHQNLKV